MIFHTGDTVEVNQFGNSFGRGEIKEIFPEDGQMIYKVLLANGKNMECLKGELDKVETEPKFALEDRVLIIPINEPGTIFSVRSGVKTGGILYTIALDNNGVTTDNLYLAREFELQEIHTLARAKSLEGDASEYQD